MTKPTLHAREKAREARDAKLGEILAGPGDPTPERSEKPDGVVETETIIAGRRQKRIKAENMLDRYVHRGQIGQAQHDAGQKLYRTFCQAGGLVRVTASWDVKVDGAGQNGMVIQMDAYRKVDDALRYVGAQLKPILVAVCLENATARDWAISRDEPAEAGIVVLRLALARLAEFYAKARGGKREGSGTKSSVSRGT